MDLIDRQAAIDACIRVRELRAYDEIEEIKALPSAEPEIIHCKDCKFWIHIKRTNRYWCKTDDGLYDLNPSPDDFCSRAKRRINDLGSDT